MFHVFFWTGRTLRIPLITAIAVITAAQRPPDPEIVRQLKLMLRTMTLMTRPRPFLIATAARRLSLHRLLRLLHRRRRHSLLHRRLQHVSVPRPNLAFRPRVPPGPASTPWAPTSRPTFPPTPPTHINPSHLEPFHPHLHDNPAHPPRHVDPFHRQRPPDLLSGSPPTCSPWTGWTRCK